MLQLAGTEELSFELGGSVAPRAARAHLPSGLGLVEVDGAARVALTVFRVRGLGVRGLPGPKLDYSEALWRLLVEHDGALAWFAVACDIDSALVRPAARALIRYPVRPSRLAIAPDGFTIAAVERELDVGLAEPVVADIESPGQRPLLVASGGRLWRVPWSEIEARETSARGLEVRADTLSLRSVGDVAWDRAALCLRGRGHRCGVAQRI